MYPFNPSAIPEDKFIPSTYFLQDLDDSLSEGARKIPSENHKLTGLPAVQSTADLNEAGPSTNYQAKHKAEETSVLNIVIPTTEKKMSARKCRKRQETRHTTSDSYLKQTLARGKLKLEKKRAMQNLFPKRKNAHLLMSGSSLQTFTKTRMKTRHVDSVA
jgi:hypothetical protein